MGSSTPNRGYLLPTISGDPTSWGTELNQTISTIDSNLGGVAQGVNVTPGTRVATAAEAQNMAIVVRGTGDCTYRLPQVGGFWIITNALTSGNLIVSTTATGGATQLVPENVSKFLWSDGSNVLTIGQSYIYGELKAWPTPQTPPAGWLICDGSALSRTTFANLFAAIGWTWGVGDGSTTFNLPDLRGRALFGVDASAGRLTAASLGVASFIGAIGGSELLQQHTHGISQSPHAHGVSDPGHQHGLYDAGHTHGINDPGHVHGVNDPQHTHGVSDPGHSHGVNDPSHSHQEQCGVGGAGGVASWALSTAASAAALTNLGTGGANTGISIQGAGTGIGIFSSLTGISLFASGTGISTQISGTGMAVYAAATQVGVLPVNANVSNQVTGGGSSQNLPPAAIIQWIIYAGP